MCVFEKEQQVEGGRQVKWWIKGKLEVYACYFVAIRPQKGFLYLISQCLEAWKGKKAGGKGRVRKKQRQKRYFWFV